MSERTVIVFVPLTEKSPETEPKLIDPSVETEAGPAIRIAPSNRYTFKSVSFADTPVRISLTFVTVPLPLKVKSASLAVA